jgi:steroid 5-alpha reductase family enzyme
MRAIFLESALILIGYATLWFIVSILKKRNDIADIAWGLGYVLLCIYHAATQPIHPVVLVCYLLVLFWGLRLSVFIYSRNRNQSEDFRYLQWRKEWGSAFYIRSFLQVYLLQGLFLFLIISPVLFAASFSQSEWTIYTGIGVLIWMIGFYWQSVGDYQLRQFIRQRKSKEEVLMTGLWKFSRHPNYFGEVTMWWGIYLIIWPLPGSLFFLFGPLTITLLIRYVSGVPMLERRYQNNEAYQAYKSKVPALFPWFRK